MSEEDTLLWEEQHDVFTRAKELNHFVAEPRVMLAQLLFRRAMYVKPPHTRQTHAHTERQADTDGQMDR